MKLKQRITSINGVDYSICPLCHAVIKYPDGVYFRNGIEVHGHCIAIARMRRGQIKGIDC